MKTKFKYISSFIAILVAFTVAFSGCSFKVIYEPPSQSTSGVSIQSAVSGFRYEDVPPYADKPFCEINNNVPYFINSDYSFDAVCEEYNIEHKAGKIISFEHYGELDKLGRCTACVASVGKDLMPTEDRGDISTVHPTGWEGNKYRIKNRCHIIGFQLAGENDNEKNLFTGTRYLNVDGMLPFENIVADYVEETGNHVLYRVTPIFVGTELMARGVLMEAYSVEDSGKGVCFCVYCYNVQEGYSIDYATGVDIYLKNNTVTNNTSSVKAEYIINPKSKKIHLPNCSALEKTAEKNKKEYSGNKEDLYAEGYSPCGYCNP